MPETTAKKAYNRAILLLPGAIHFDHIQTQFKEWFVDSLIIAVDKGIDKAHLFHNYREDYPVDLWVGDFDSSHHLQIDPALYGQKIPYPVDKDEIDTELALSMAVEQGVSEVLILGGIGGRIDHQMALLFLPFQYPMLTFIHSNGEQTLYHLRENSAYQIPTSAGSLISVVALTALEGLTLLHVKWPLHDYSLPLGRGLTYSNRALGESIAIEIKSGSAWLFTAMPDIDDSL